MKKSLKTFIISIFALLLSMSLFVGCGSDNQEVISNDEEIEVSTGFKEITTDELKAALEDDNYIIVDTRINDAFNGWALDGVSRGGHITGAVDFSANWLNVDVENKDSILDEALNVKGIDKDKNIVLYDSNDEDALAVATYLNEKGYENIYIYTI